MTQGAVVTIPDEIMFRKVMSYLATAVSVVTTKGVDYEHGAIISALSSVSMKPFLLLICLHRKSATYRAITAAEKSALSILGSDYQAVAILLASCNTNKFNFEIIERSADVTAFVKEFLVKIRRKLVETF